MTTTGAGEPPGEAARPRRFYLHVGLPKTGTVDELIERLVDADGEADSK